MARAAHKLVCVCFSHIRFQYIKRNAIHTVNAKLLRLFRIDLCEDRRTNGGSVSVCVCILLLLAVTRRTTDDMLCARFSPLGLAIEQHTRSVRIIFIIFKISSEHQQQHCLETALNGKRKKKKKKSVYALRRAQSTCEYIRFIKRLAFFLHKIFSFTFSTCFVLLLHLDKAELRVATSMHDIIIGAVFANSKIECTIYDMFFHCFDEWICVKSANECFPLQDEQRPVEVCSDIIAKTWI